MKAMAKPGLHEMEVVAPEVEVPQPASLPLSTAQQPLESSAQQPLASSAQQPLASSVDGDGGLARAFVRGSVVGSVVVFLLLGGLALATGAGLGPAVGVGAFTAFWGGPGFGGMMGAVLHYSRNEGQH